MPKKIQRFYWVGSPKSNTIHRCSSPTYAEGSLTWCGFSIPKGWSYWMQLRQTPPGSSLCLKCEVQANNP